MKKLLVGAASAAMLLSVAMPAFAFDFHHQQPTTTTTAVVQNNNVVVVANSGLNRVTSSAPTTLVTGFAGAEGKQVIVANVSTCNTCRTGVTTTSTVKNNNVVVVANSGLNGVTTLTPPTAPSHHHSSVTAPTTTVVTGDTSAYGQQWVVTNVSL